MSSAIWSMRLISVASVRLNHLPPKRQSRVDYALLIVEFSLSYSGTPHSVEAVWTSDQPDAENST